MAPSLPPRWTLTLPFSPGDTMFDPLLLDGRGLLVVGGPQGLVLFAVGNRRSVFTTIPKRSWIMGFTVHGTSLYVQDGPVLLGYDLVTGKPFAALNLVTQASWPSADDPSDTPPDSLFELDAADAALQAALNEAREASSPGLLTATQDAQRIVFSAPVIRSRQVDGRLLGQVVTLRMDGQIHSMDDGLQDMETYAAAAPLRAELVMAELVQPSGQVLCHLYYVSATGGIVAIDATGDMAPLPGWPAKGPPVPESVLPLRFIDGVLMGGGILGCDYFATGLDPSRPPLINVQAPAGGWRQYDVATAEKLVTLSDGQQSRLVSYEANAGTRDRWQLRPAPAPSFTLFWTDTGADAVVPGPKLVIEADVAPAGATRLPGLRFLLANTIDAPANGGFTDYPPPATELGSATLERGSPPLQLPPIGLVPCRPVVAGQTLYAVFRSAPSSDPAGKYTVAAFAIGALLPPLLQAATERLAELQRMALRSGLHITWRITTVLGEREPTRVLRTVGPHDLANEPVTLMPSQGPPFKMMTDGNGKVVLDSRYSGQHMNLDLQRVPVSSSDGYAGDVKCAGVTLVPNAVNELNIEIIRRARA